MPPNLQNHQQNAATVHLMVDPSQIPNVKGQFVHVFNLHDGIRHIVGYCLPLKYCGELFKYIQPARVIKSIEVNQHHQEQLSTKYKFISTPLSVAPMNDKEYQEMMRSPPVPSPNWPFFKNRFFVRQMSPNSTLKSAQLFDDSAMNYVTEKFKLHANPHLIPYRLHDGLDCFIRLELASHCQQDDMDGDGAYEDGHLKMATATEDFMKSIKC